jgi:actin-related protein 5
MNQCLICNIFHRLKLFLLLKLYNMSMSSTSTIFSLPVFPPLKTSPNDSYEEYRNECTPLVIDNGSTSLRWGFSTALSPRSGPNIVSKYRERKSNKQLLLFGDGLDADSTSKSQAKMPWEGDVLLNFDGMV